MDHLIFDREAECSGSRAMKELQLDRLKDTVAYAYDKIPHYRKKFDAVGLRPSHIRSLKDIELIPYTTKEDLRENYPYGMFATPMRDVIRVHASSGTTGNPTVVGYTKNDIELWSELCARFIYAAGANPDDIAQVAFGYGLFTGGFGLHYGLEKAGIAVIPISGGNTERQFKIMQDFHSTLLISTPSYALYMGETAKKMNIDMDKISLRIGLFGGEGHTDEMSSEIEKGLGILDTENYGLSEVIGPGYSGECYVKNGMHIADDHFISEVIDPDTGNVLPVGETGELVITSLTKEALPVLRYRTKDVTQLIEGQCKCGRTNTRMKKVMGRTDDMLIIRGVNVFPSQIESVLVGMEEIGPHYEIVVYNENFMDRLEVRVELADAQCLDSYANLERLEEKVKHNIFAMLNIHVKVSLVEPYTLKRFEGKAKRVTDLRKQ